MILAALLLSFLPQHPLPTQATLRVSPEEAQMATGQAGGPFTPSVIPYTVSNIGNTAMTWTVTSDVNWLTLSSAGGTIPRRSSTAWTATIDSDANSLAIGNYTGTLTFTNTVNGQGNCTRLVELSVGGVDITPGAGWGGPTSEPGQIGSGTAKCVARWDVVQHQTVVEANTATFHIGVVAFHIAGIDKVMMSAEDGTWVDISTPTLNPLTGVYEYVGTLTLSDFTVDGEVEVRAIAYPKSAAPQAAGTDTYPGGGYPRLLDSLFLYFDVDTAQSANEVWCSVLTGDDANAGTAAAPVETAYKAAQIANTAGGGDAGGATIYMYPGDYPFTGTGASIPVAAERWVTFTHVDGETRDSVHIIDSSFTATTSIPKVRLYDITLDHYVHGDSGGSGGMDKVWVDSCVLNGSDATMTTHSKGFTPGFDLGQFYTDVIGSDDGNATAPSGAELVRDCQFARCWRGPQFPKLVINCLWEDVQNFGVTGVHSSCISYNLSGVAQANGICYGLEFRQAQATGVFIKDISAGLSDVAIVNCAFELLGTGGSEVGQGTTSAIDHLVYLNNTHLGATFRWDEDQANMTNLTLRGNLWQRMAIGDGDTVKTGWFDASHYSDVTGLTTGTDVTTGDPILLGFRPQVSSPLLARMNPLVIGVDLDSALRPTPGAVGCLEQ